MTDPGRSGASGAGTYKEQRRLWLLGDLLYGRDYHGVVTVTNDCAREQRFGLFAYDLPDLVVVPAATIGAGETARLPYLLSTRRPPSATAAPVKGELVIWRPGGGPDCRPLRMVQVARGRLRSVTPADERADAAVLEDAAMRAACAMWWLYGKPPSSAALDALPPVARSDASRADAAVCADFVRSAACDLRRHRAEHHPGGADRWAWLPDDAAFDRMSISELAEFRARVVKTDAAGEGK